MLKMNRLFLILVFITDLSFAQTSKSFLTDFLLGDELKTSNLADQYKKYDYSKILTKTGNQLIYGIIGSEHERIRVKLISVEKSFNNPNEYLVFGKSKVKETICDFKGIINITAIKEMKKPHFGVDNEYANKGIKSQGIIIADYEFHEQETKHSGTFKGQLYSKWYLNSKNQIEYDDIQLMSDGYFNNAFIGMWISDQTKKEKICSWADYRVPKANKDFDIGVGEFNVAEKYMKKGWLDVALKNQVPNSSIKKDKSFKKQKDWYE